jgi:hypothetical protein
MRRLTRAVAFALLPLLVLPGCIFAAAAAVAAVAVGVVSYENNEAWMDYKGTLDQLWNATLQAMRKQGYVVPGDPKPNATEGTIEAGETRVVVETHAGGYVRVRVRVGTFTSEDNERKAKLLIEEVTAQLPK